MAFKELATRRFSVRKYTDELVSKEEAVAIVPIGHIAPAPHLRRRSGRK